MPGLLLGLGSHNYMLLLLLLLLLGLGSHNYVLLLLLLLGFGSHNYMLLLRRRRRLLLLLSVLLFQWGSVNRASEALIHGARWLWL